MEEKQVDNLTSPAGDPLRTASLQMLMGSGPFRDPQRQAALAPRILAQSKAAALEAFSAVSQMGKPSPPYLQVKQGTAEPFLAFVDRIREAVDNTPDLDPDIKTTLVKEVAAQNANATCKRFLTTLRPGATLVQMVEVCSRAPLEEEKHKASIHATALAAALKQGGLGKGGRGSGSGVCFQCGKMGHLKRFCPTCPSNNPSVPSAFSGICNRCEKFGHRAAECRSGFKKDGSPLPGNQSSRESGVAQKYPTSRKQAMVVSTSSPQPPQEAQELIWPWQEQ